MSPPQRVQITRNRYGRASIPRDAVRVDRGSPWRSPFWIDQPAIVRIMQFSLRSDTKSNRMLLVTKLHFAWLMGLTGVQTDFHCLPRDLVAELPDPPSLLEIERSLRGKVLADWAEIGLPCIGDVLLAIANRRADGSLFPTASDDFQPEVLKRKGNNQFTGSRSELGYAAWGR